MKKLTAEDMTVWLLANKYTNRLKKQYVIKPDLFILPKIPNNDILPIKPKKTKQKFKIEKRKLTAIPKQETPKQLKKAQSNGSFKAETTIDLHGYSLQQAHDHLQNFLGFCYRTGKRKVMVITGHGDDPASIKREFCIWMEESCIKQYITSYKEAHQRQGGAGAYYVIIKRNQNV